MLSKCNLPFRRSSEELSRDNKGNCFSILQFLAKHITVVDKVLQLTKGSPRYLNSLIKNELISVLAEEVPRDIKSKLLIQNAPFLPLFLIPIKMSAKQIVK